MDLSNKIVLVTGASSGIGKETALLLAEHGANIAISYKENNKGAEDVVSEIKKLNREVISTQANLSREQDSKMLVSRVIDNFGKIDILVNNAGGYIEGDEYDGSQDVWIESIKQNLTSTLNVTKFAYEYMKKQQSGIIVNISSRYSISGQYDAISYSAAKSGIVNITQAYAKLMLPWGRCNCVSPGTTRAGYWTKISKEEFDQYIGESTLIEPAEVAKVVYFLSSDHSKILTGQNLIADAGDTLK